MSKEQAAVAKELKHYLDLYAISPSDDSLNGILIYSAMLVGDLL